MSGTDRFVLDVDPDGLEIAAHSWQLVADEVGALALSLAGLEGTVQPQDFSGRTRQAVFTETAGLSRELSRFEPLVHRAAAELRSLAQDARDVMDTRLPALNRSWQDAAGTRDRLLRAVERDAGTAGGPGTDGSRTNGSGEDGARARAACEDCREQQRALERRFEGLVEDLRERFARAARVIAGATVVDVPADVIGQFNALGLTGAVPAWCSLDGGTFPPEFGAAQELRESLPLAWAHHAARRATALARDLAAADSIDTRQVHELRGLLEDLQADPACPAEFLTDLGARGLIDLTFALSNSGAQARADATAVQTDLGQILATATTDVGDTGNVTRSWADDLRRTGRDQHTFPSARTTVQARGYTALGVLLGHGTFSAGFLETVGGDILDLERTAGSRGSGSAGFWVPTVLDPGTGLATDAIAPPDPDLTGTRASGWDPVVGLMTAVGKDRATAQAFFLEDRTFLPGSRTPRPNRVDYLLTDRDWTTTSTAPVTWTRNGWDTHDPAGLQALGNALVRATVPATGDTGSLRILESIVHVTGSAENLKNTHITDTDLVGPVLRLPLARILGASITEIHRAFGLDFLNVPDEVDRNKYLPGVQEEGADLAEDDVTRLLADLARDPDAAEHLTRQETAFTAALYHEYIADGGIVDRTFTRNAEKDIREASGRSGRILGALQIGDALHRGEEIAEQEQKDEQEQQAFDNARTFIQSLVDLGITAGTIAHPVAGETARSITSVLIDSLQDPRTDDRSGRAAYDTITALHHGDSTARGILEQAVFLNALPEISFRTSFTDKNGELVPIDQWNSSQKRAWKDYLARFHGYHDSINNASDSFLGGTKRAENALGISVNSLDGSAR